MTDRRCEPVCSILSHAAIELRLSEIGAVREIGPPTLPKRFLRHCDEQTVAGVVAMLAAIERLGEPRPSFDGWGVLSATCQSGRIMGAAAVIATTTAGSQGVSPHLVPQCSLHSPASAVSVALGMHGPHFGIGGGPEAFDEAMLSACSLFADATSSAWLVMTAWDEEPSLDVAGKPLSDPVLVAVALALVAGRDRAAEAVIRLEPPASAARPHEGIDREFPSMASRLRSLARAIDAPSGDASLAISLRHGFVLQLEPAVAAARETVEVA